MKTFFPLLHAAKRAQLDIKRVVATDDLFKSCDIHLEGVNIGTFVRRGDGSTGEFHVTGKDFAKLVDLLRGSLPAGPESPAQSSSDAQYAELQMMNLIAEKQLFKLIKKSCKTKTLFVLAQGQDSFTTQDVVFNRRTRSKVLEQFGDKICFFLNEDIKSL
jgi:hypothetical protein